MTKVLCKSLFLSPCKTINNTPSIRIRIHIFLTRSFRTRIHILTGVITIRVIEHGKGRSMLCCFSGRRPCREGTLIDDYTSRKEVSNSLPDSVVGFVYCDTPSAPTELRSNALFSRTRQRSQMLRLLSPCNTLSHASPLPMLPLTPCNPCFDLLLYFCRIESHAPKS